jgi:hypothetical protein
LRTQDSGCLDTYLSFVTDRYQISECMENSPCDRLNPRDLARIQEGVRSTTEGSPDVESDDEFSRGARVTSAGYVHGGGWRTKRI